MIKKKICKILDKLDLWMEKRGKIVLPIIAAVLFVLIIFTPQYTEVKTDEYQQILAWKQQFKNDVKIQNKIKEIIKDKIVYRMEYNELRDLIRLEIKKKLLKK